jgi:hypothetical protein
MTPTTLNSALGKQAGASIDAVATEIQHAARQELDALRSAMSARLTALDRALSRDQNDPAFAPVVEKLCEVAGEQTEAASTWARAQAVAEAARQLAAARAQAQADLDAAQTLSEATRLELEQRLAKAEAATAGTAQALADLRAQTDAALLEGEQRLAKADAATAGTAQALADLRAQTDAALLEGEQRLAQSEAARVEAALALAETERAAAAARRDADTAAASLADARTEIAALEGVRAELLLAHDISEAHLEGEVHHRNAITAELEAAHEKALHAKADADACRLELQRAAVRIHVLEERQRQRDGESPGATTSEAATVLGQVRSALQRVSNAATGRGLLDAALESLAESFSRVALCAVEPQGCTVWGSRGFDPPLQNRKALIPLTADSPLVRALADSKPVTVRVTDGEELFGVSGGPIGYAIALPIVAQDRCLVMLYAENPPELSNGDPSVAEKIAEILADLLGQRLRPRGTASATAPPQYSPARQAPRVKIQEGTSVAVDGAPSKLLDLSTLGAQVLSPRAIRPNRSVRLQLPSDTGALSCEARVVWVLVEPGLDHQKALYRAGVQFTDVDTPELEAFFSQHGVLEPAIRH